jgi:hypothetical protein
MVAMPETMMMRFLTRVEVVNAVASVAMTIGLVIACLLLNSSYQELKRLQAAAAQRGQVNAAVLQELERQSGLLQQTLQRLERR